MTTSTENLVITERRGDVAWLTINRPKKLNALSVEVIADLSAALTAAESDPAIKVVVLQGSDRAFSVGYDIAQEVEMGVSTAEQWHGGLTNNIGLSMQVWRLNKPVIAAVSGWCLAGGCELAMACDLIVAADDAQFGEPEIRFGSGPVTLLMPFLIGQKATNELLYTGDIITAERAETLGMINRVVAKADLDQTVDALARKIALTPLSILRYTKRAITRAYDAMGLTSAVESNLDIAAVLNSAYTPEREEFTKLVATKGLGAALAWRDERYGEADK
ncbi:enoyl-CoA hydratase/isomerase family protein [Mycolicibacterium goodii]|uniref:enoyl-CoA hydratase/isomerase family protein n=1 Tax=Mycolicibacterium goodii TaxID=134601 RepID=UPI001BDD4FF1|nr:enoyl-CoA hydratase/isomerase family protein [Mycolicibacterium goodii]MBU8816799.1 enoyl-CoA hydratase/isomerase family protein [Mycolicibacterium goodii]MBU8828282.1 enoyl-CoA hydratase/isomerase family protein [Mycolicibacterium goodii]